MRTFGGDPIRAEVFPDSALSSTSMERPGLERLMRAGFATGAVPFGFGSTSVTDATGRLVHPIEINPEDAAIIVRIFTD